MNSSSDPAKQTTESSPKSVEPPPVTTLKGPSWRFQLTVGALVLGSGVVLSTVLASLAPDPIPPGPPEGSELSATPAESCRSAPRRGNTLRVFWGATPSLNDGGAAEHPALSIFVHESILASSQRAGVATAKPSDDGNGFRVTLRPQVRVHPGPCTPAGKTLDARDVAYSIRRFQRAQKRPEAGLGDIEIVDAQSLHIRRLGSVDVLELLRQVPARFRELETCTAPAAAWAGTGPFVRVSAPEEGTVRLKRFDDYWAKSASEVGLPLLDAVEFAAESSVAQALKSAQKGAIHWLDLNGETTVLNDPAGPRPVLKPEHRSPNVRVVVDAEPPPAKTPAERGVYVVSPRVCGLADDASGRVIRPMRAAMFWLR